MHKISKPVKDLRGTINLTTSKSESNRLLLIQALCKEHFDIQNIAEAEDTQTLLRILEKIKGGTDETTFDIGPAGTTMRFLTAYFATLPGTRILTGSERMKERPIKILVDALKELGADIHYIENEGYPPLKITGKDLKGGEIMIDGSISSQYISAILLISPSLFTGLTIRFEGMVISRPYIDMTLKIMEMYGVSGHWHDNSLTVSKQDYYVEPETENFTVEADWTSASYWYTMAALANEVKLKLKGLRKNSFHGDAVLADLFTFFGVNTTFEDDGVLLTKAKVKEEAFGFDFSDSPDIVPSAAVVVSALKIPSLFNGLQTLKIKETDRVLALQRELEKVGIIIKEEDKGSVSIDVKNFNTDPGLNPTFATYQDHRMAMSFATLAYVYDIVNIENPEVVRKSYPRFWDDLKSVGFLIKEL